MPKLSNISRAVALVLATACIVQLGPLAFAAPSPSPVPTPTNSIAVGEPNPATPTSTPTATATPTPTPYPTPGAACSAASATKSKDLGKLYAYAIDAKTGRVLLDIRGGEQTPSASVLKVVTAATAMEYLPDDYSAKTSVYSVPSEPGTLVLVGGGDHTLSALTGTSFTTYPKAPRLDALAARVLQTWSGPDEVIKIVLVDNFFAGPAYNAAWKASDRTNGYISLITSLQVDADRANPDLSSTKYSGYRSTDPVMRTGKAFKASLLDLAPNAKLVAGKLPAGARLIAQVSSQPITSWLDHALTYSDNTETEFIARHAVKAAGLPASFASIQSAATKALKANKIDPSGLVMKDASGLAQADRVTAKVIAQIMAQVANPESKLAAMANYLPVAGESGTLAGRFNGKNAVAAGNVLAKSGYIPGLYSLAGLVKSRDGGTIAFAAFARSADGKKVGYLARPALDTLAARIYQCGVSLTK
ncbi:MAG: D-alanyl-D-alanine carboxypeptidase/D-alanyl-D-alanine-endopeptidase [Actinomycetales bacterium]|nr:D-alanyl-D-alanine carboxypeptidase/D-alanyl-D-alanine-endopeptidase [Actinomycetales bacterium]